MDQNFGPMLVGPGYFRFNNNSLFVLTYGQAESLFIGDNTDTYLVAAGTGTVTAIFGDGFNVARGGRGDVNFVGGEGNNFFFGGMGNDTLIGGSNYDVLSGGDGYDFIVFGENDFVSGGEGADTFVLSLNEIEDTLDLSLLDPILAWYQLEEVSVDEGDLEPVEVIVEYVTVADFMAEEDVLDLSQAGIDRQSLRVKGDALVYTTEWREIWIEGAGEEIDAHGGIDAVIESGNLVVANYVPVDDMFYP
ncbi:MAG: hypothetical protein KBD16_04325 [Candidatus Pacebacteria bacterium]|nr:hypothetical protein [Candidatus Paceibacterota bacterium]